MEQRYDIRSNPPTLSREQIEKRKNFDALLSRLQQEPKEEPFDVQETPPPLSREAINKRKNFQALLAQYQEQPATPSSAPPKGAVLRLVKYGLGGILAVAASVTVVLMIGKTQEADAYRGEPLALTEPLPELPSKSFDTYSLDADKGDTLLHQSGSRLIVPATAFVDKKGKPVRGKVEVEYRELNDHVDMFVAGIPKQIDKHQNLQSIGMIQVQGYQNGQPVYIDPAKPLQVELPMEIPADIPTDAVKLYAFNAKTNEWEARGNDAVEVVAVQQPKTEQPQPNTGTGDYQRALQQALARIENRYAKPTQPVEPGKHDPKKMPFDLDIRPEQFPELKNYAGILWEPAPGFEFDKRWAEKEWDNLDIRRKEGNVYSLAWSDAQETVRLEVVPVYKNEVQRQQALELYRKDLAAYEAALRERQTKIDGELAAWENDNAAKYAQHLQDTTAAPSGLAASGTKKILNRFRIDRFGLWNCGNPQLLDERKEVGAAFVDAQGKPLSVQQVFVYNPKHRFYYFSPATDRLKYDEQTPSVVWVMTKDGRLFAAPSAPQKQDEGYRFSMEPVVAAKDENRLREYLNAAPDKAYYN